MSLPSKWVEEIHTRLLTRYGSAWLMMWEGIDMAAVRQDWAEELSGFVDKPECIKYGLDNLPVDRPPSVQQFAAACNRAPTPTPPALPAPPADPERVAAALEAIKPAAGPADRLAWARRLRAREWSARERLTPFQRSAWRELLGDAQ